MQLAIVIDVTTRVGNKISLYEAVIEESLNARTWTGRYENARTGKEISFCFLTGVRRK